MFLITWCLFGTISLAYMAARKEAEQSWGLMFTYFFLALYMSARFWFRLYEMQGW